MDFNFELRFFLFLFICLFLYLDFVKDIRIGKEFCVIRDFLLILFFVIFFTVRRKMYDLYRYLIYFIRY